MSQLHVIVLTLNEERHIARCLESVAAYAASITVIDSGSQDQTVSIAKKYGANVLSNAWTNYAEQLNFAVDALSGQGGWLMRIDADEVLEPATGRTITESIRAVGDDVHGLLVRRRIYFLGRRIRHGAIEPSWQLRIWRCGKGRCEERWMDEHVVVQGKIEKTDLSISDINLNSISWWTSKHNAYASREAIDALNHKYSFDVMPASERSHRLGRQAMLRKFFKRRIYSFLPFGLRAQLYFLYRYFLRFGFLDGRQGYLFHVLQGLWYRTLVDAKIAEIEAYTVEHSVSIVTAIRALTGHDPIFASKGMTRPSDG